MIKAFYHSIFAVVIFIAFSCSDGKKLSDQVRLSKPETNEYAAYFKICRQDSFSVLVTYLNVEKTDSAVYVLYRAKKPELGKDVYYVRVPVQKVACLSSVFVGFLDKLGVLTSLAAVDNMDFVSNATVNYLHAKGSVKELSKNGQLNIEETLLSQVQTIFTNPSGDARKDFDKRLTDIGIIPVVCADYYEMHPLGRAEWIKAFATFYGAEGRADSLFNKVRENYLALKNAADTCKYKPSVFTEKKTNDTWFVAGGKSSMAQLLNDAGADYLWKDNGKTSPTAMNMEQVMQKALDADYWINLHLCNSADELFQLDHRYEKFNAFKRGNLYNNNALTNAKGGNAYWETGLCNPDEILKDLVKIFHPDLLPGHQLKYYKQLK